MKAVCGDFVGIEEESAKFFEYFCVELKTSPSARFTDVLDPSFLKFHDEVFLKTFWESINAERLPIIVFKMKRFEVVSTVWQLATTRNLPFLLRPVGDTPIEVSAIIDLKRFFNEDPVNLRFVAPEVLHQIYSQRS